ncbi:uncharacterized protein LOC105701413 [Orussus abietinus]|uniref:uncharacterized protein LOC105701413 n=1 Tax=Orussus abietinus TaxID=222816 RepID=UPI0006259772|nr:uncharacterized protein LOC105701413 [Orussus abietinus]
MVKTEGVVGRTLKMDDEEWRIWMVYRNEDMGKTARKIKELVKKEEEEEEGRLIIGGDFNARIGREGYLYDQETSEKDGESALDRKSKDVIKNAGDILLQLVEDRGWHFTNGNMPRDEDGEYTYVGSRRATVISYALLNTESRSVAKKCMVEHRVESNHQPLCLNWKSKVQEETKEKEGQRKSVIKYEKESIQFFKEESERIVYVENNIQAAWEELENKMKKCLDIREITLKEKEIDSSGWWDRQCRSEKRKVRKNYRRWKMGKASKEEYLEKKKALHRAKREKERKGVRGNQECQKRKLTVAIH